jgi:hypothetical protein
MSLLLTARELWWMNQEWLESDTHAQQIRSGSGARVALYAHPTRIKDEGYVSP